MRVSHGQVQRRIILEILRVHVDTPGLQVVRRCVGACDARPMQWCAPFSVFGHDREAFCPEVSQAVGLITLSGNVQHIYTLFRQLLIIRLVAHQ